MAVEGDDRRVRDLVSSVAEALIARQAAITDDIRAVIASHIPGLEAADLRDILDSSISENVRVALDRLDDPEAGSSIEAPVAARDFARRLANNDIPAATLLRAYRLGQTRFLRRCIEELLTQTTGDHLEGQATLQMAENVSQYIDRVVEQVLATYEATRDAKLRDRSAMLAGRVREIIQGSEVDIKATEKALDYRLDRHHVAAILWVEPGHDSEGLARIRRLVATLHQELPLEAAPLLVAVDESSAWAWLPSKRGLAHDAHLIAVTKTEASVLVALGEPAPGVQGFCRSHRQAGSARAVALAAGEQKQPITPFVDVAPIAMLCADLEGARAWISETLGELALNTPRNEGLRETTRVFLQTGGSYTATAEQLYLHRNTAQYRVRKAEEARGRPLREGRLDVEVALLACHWLRAAVLQAK
jgi:DNA-binding PucR family transcriptional regulator